jgi:alpha,alpha-trehalase
VPLARAALRHTLVLAAVWLAYLPAPAVAGPGAADRSARPGRARPQKAIRPRVRRPPRRVRSAATRLRPAGRLRVRAAAHRVATRPDPVREIHRHIGRLWNTKLRRGPATLLAALQDPKLPADATPTLYVSHLESPERVRGELRRHLGADVDRIRIRRLPARGNQSVPEHGLLYLPNDFVVPGYSAEGQENRFNEQYNWDTHRMVTGMLVTGQTALARGMVDNQLYEVRHYGTVLNANRTWSRSRSQPPFLTQSILAIYKKTGDRVWLRSTLDAAEAYHRYWTGNARRSATGLSRYVDTGRGLPAEAAAGEFERDKDRFRAMPEAESARYFDRARDRLTPHFIKGTRSLRASGVDTTDRFGPNGGDTHEYNPVDLNSLLFRMELDLAEIHRELAKDGDSGGGMGHHERAARRFERRADVRRRLVVEHMWDAKRGQFFDFNFKTGRRSTYEFATTFTPLVTGLATPEQAYRVLKRALPRFEAPFGLRTSMRDTGHQWDGGVGWAPFVEDAVMGLRRFQGDPAHGAEFKAAADRLSVNYLTMVAREFQRTGHLYEKYDVEKGSARVKPRFGYTSNEMGFGWTNAAFLRLYDGLGESGRAKVKALETVPVPE